MKLFLASEAKHPESLKKLDKFVDGFKDKRIVYVPTAANGDFFGAWKSGESIKKAQSLNPKEFDVVQLEDNCFREVISQIKGADILWIAGGMSGYLLYWMRRVELDKALVEILEKGTVYVGSSAGSMVCAKTQYSAEWYLGEPEPGVSLMPGLGLIDFEIYPHFEDEQLPEINRRWKEAELWLLKDGEVITVDNDRVEVLGEKRVLNNSRLKKGDY